MAETDTVIYMIESKSNDEMDDKQVLAKQVAALKWCKNASDHAATYHGKKWEYLLVTNNLIPKNMKLTGIAGACRAKGI